MPQLWNLAGHGAPAAAPSGGYQIARSLRFNSADTAFLSRTPGSPSNRKTWTASFWVKRAKFGTDQNVFSVAETTGTRFQFTTGDLIKLWFDNATTNVSTTAVFRDPSAWYHFVWAIDTRLGPAATCCRLYVNNVEQTLSGTFPSLNYDGFINNNQLHHIGKYWSGGAEYFDGYLADFNFVDGQQLTPASFGEVDATTGAWIAKSFSGSYGPNGFHLDFFGDGSASATGIGKDVAGSNNWTPTNLSVTAGVGNDSLVDTPTNYGTDTGAGGEVRGNYATLNPLSIGNGGGTFSQGNLQYVGPTGFRAPIATIMLPFIGKWQIEAVMTGTPAGSVWGAIWGAIGVCRPSMVTNAWDPNTTAALIVADCGKYHNFSSTDVNYNGGSVLTAADVVTLVIDRDANTFNLYINGTLKTASPSLGSTAGEDLFFFSASYGATRYLSDVNFGQRTFTVDANAKALCTQNLPEGSITASGSFTGNATADGPFVWLNGTPTTMAINGNAVTFATHADKLAGGFKLRTSSSSYNASGTNNYVVSATGAKFKYARAQGNP